MQTIDIATPDGTSDALFVHPGSGTHPAVLLFPDAFGPRPALTELAETISARGYAVLLPNLFYRAGRAPVVELPDFVGPENRHAVFDKIRPLMARLTPELALRDAGAYLDWLAAAPEVADGGVGLTGYCMGAALVLRTAAAYPERVAAGAGFHGGRLASDAADSPHLDADRITAELYFGHADADPSLPPEQIERLNKALDSAGVRYRAEVYAGAAHGFTQRDLASYDAEADARHLRELGALLDRALG
ncbi:dienelactone hydrolase family protein [Nocardia asteroides]|uniref:dienelactone hydrolase family protein n=1 Tax=Nocardia asteroides TaxID=1824 RepID=UPI001E5C7D62|nr:dienelactone hydrolase family protein [Nocardia asteroides]UGT65012.1 dienelactone hydrolase family protein [Nocardia asteroides]